MNSYKQIKIFLVNYDWNDMQRTDRENFIDKLRRDHLDPDNNDFFFFSWARVSYKILEGNLKTIHKKTYLYSLKPLLDLRAIFSVFFAAKKYGVKPDVWMTYDFGMLPALWFASKFFGGKVLLNVNNQPRIYSRTRRFGLIKSIYSACIERLWKNLPDHVVTINDTLKKYLMDLGIPASNITVMYFGTISRDLRLIEGAKEGVIRDLYSIPETSKIILSVARLEAEKNHEKMLELFSKLGHEYFLIILGKGSLQPKLEQMAKSLGIGERVKFPGFINRDKIWDYYKDADVFALLSRAEALGIVFWEAMHIGVPVIGSDADGIVETIGSDGERGRIWREGEGIRGFKEKLDYCIEKNFECRDMIKRARSYVDEQRKNEITILDLPLFRN